MAWELDEPSPLWAPLLWAGAAAFSGVSRARHFAYRAGLLETVRLGRPVISVGNLTVGGNSKTPLVAWLVARLRERGVEPVIVARSFGASPGAPLIAAQRGAPPRPAEEIGDEARLLAQLTGAAVVVGRSKRRAAELAIAELGAQAIVVDDGFQHLALARDLDLLLLDAARPFGNGHLLPRGSLREPKEAIARATLVGLVYAPGVSQASPEAPPGDFALSLRALELRPIGGGPALGLGALAGREVALAAAIARPERFAALVRSLGATVVAEAYFRDHQPIPPEALERLGRQASLIVVTAKDAARWSEPPAGSVAVLETGLELARGQERLGEALDRALRGPP